jgi:hypothetical protein
MRAVKQAQRHSGLSMNAFSHAGMGIAQMQTDRP